MSSSPDSEVLDRPTHHVPGEAYIPQDERAGLPGGDIESYSHRKASQVVQAHRRGLFSRMNPRSRSQSPAAARHRKRRTFLASDGDTDVETDIEHAGESRASVARPRPGTSILSSLLALYDTGGSSPIHHARSFEDSRASSLYETTTNETDYNEKQPAAPQASPQKQRPWKVFANRTRSEPTAKRPGVFGALVASTNNLSGAAAPGPSTIAPSFKRPGYHLSR